MEFLPLIALLAVFYFLVLRPQQKRAKEHAALVSALQKGDEVVTIGGVRTAVECADNDDCSDIMAFGFGSLDFAGQWLMKAGIGGFAWLTIASGWGMSLVYLTVLIGTLRAVLHRSPTVSTNA